MGRDVDFTDQGVANFFEAIANGTNKIGVRAPAAVAADIDIELLGVLPAGTEVLTIDPTGQIGTTAIGAGNLDDSYNFPTPGAGRAILADNGAVLITSPAASGNRCLTLTQGDTQDALLVTQNGVTAGGAINVVSSVASVCISVDQNGDAIAVSVDVDAASTNAGVNILNAGTGPGLSVTQTGIALGLLVTQNAIFIAAQFDQTQNAVGVQINKTGAGAGDALNVNNDGIGFGIQVVQDGAESALMVVQNGLMDAVRIVQTQDDNGLFIQKQGLGAGDALLVQNLGTSPGVHVDQDGDGIAVFVDIDAASTSVGVSIVNPGTGDAIDINQTGNARGVDIAMPATGTSEAIRITATNGYAGTCILIDSVGVAVVEGIRVNVPSISGAAIHTDGGGIGVLVTNSNIVLGDTADSVIRRFRIRGTPGFGVGQIVFDDGVNAGVLSYSHITDDMNFSTSNALQMVLDSSGNLTLGGTFPAPSGAGVVHLTNDTAPVASIANGVQLYSEDVAASAELRVRDEAGNVTTLSPHAKIPGHELSEDMAWSFYSQRQGKYIWVDMLRVIRLLERLGGEELAFIGKAA